MIMLKSLHEAALEQQRLAHKLALAEADAERVRDLQAARDEATAARFELIAERNKVAALRGRLVAFAHEHHLPAPESE